MKDRNTTNHGIVEIGQANQVVNLGVKGTITTGYESKIHGGVNRLTSVKSSKKHNKVKRTPIVRELKIKTFGLKVTKKKMKLVCKLCSSPII